MSLFLDDKFILDEKRKEPVKVCKLSNGGSLILFLDEMFTFGWKVKVPGKFATCLWVFKCLDEKSETDS